MSIATAITTMQERIANAYTAVSSKGGTVPATPNLENLSTAINSISGGGSVTTMDLDIPTTITTYEPWTRPNMTSANSYGVASGSRYSGDDPWYAFDNSMSTGYYTYSGRTGEYLRWTLPINITFIKDVSQITITCYRGYSTSKYWRIYGDTARTKPITQPFTLVNGNKVVTADTNITTNVFDLYLADSTPDYVGIYNVAFSNVYVKNGTGPISDINIYVLDTHSETVANAIQGQTTGYKNDVYMVQEGSTKSIVACKTGTTPAGNFNARIRSTTANLYLNASKTEVRPEAEGLSTSVITQEGQANFNIMGSPTITNRVVSGFSTSNFLILPNKFTPGTNTWEACYKIKTGTSSNAQWIQGSPNATDYQLPLFGVNGGKWTLYISSNGTSWNIAENRQGSYSVLTNTVYWVKCVYNGSSYVLSYSLDGNTWVTDVTVSNSTPIYQTPTTLHGLGINQYNTTSSSWQIFSGSIYLNESYIKVNGETWWQPYYENNIKVLPGHKYIDETNGYFELESTLVKTPSQLIVHPEDFEYCETENFTKVGNPSISNKILSGGSSSNYLSLSSYQGTINSFEFVFCLNGTNTGSEQTFYGTTNTGTDRFKNFQCNIKNDGKLEIAINSSSSWLYLLSSTNTLPSGYFLVKYSWDGSVYKIHFSTDDGSTWSEEGSYESSTAPVSFDTIAFGTGGSSSAFSPFNGSIDLSKTYFKINGETWWQPYVTQQEVTNYTIVGSPSVSNKVASGFSTSNYLKIERYTGAINSFEYVLKIKTPTDWTGLTSNFDGTMGQITTNKTTPQLQAYSTSGSWVGMPDLSSQWVTSLYGRILDNDTIYWVKFIWDGTTSYYYLSTDGETYDLEASGAQSSVSWTEDMAIGIDQSTFSKCTIYLEDCYIKINGETWWEPYSTVSYKAGYTYLIKPTSSTTTSILTGIQNPTAAYAGSVCTPLSLGKKVTLDPTLTNITGSEDI